MDHNEKHEKMKAQRAADRPRLAAYLMEVANDASDYQNDFNVPLTRTEIYTIWEALQPLEK